MTSGLNCLLKSRVQPPSFPPYHTSQVKSARGPVGEPNVKAEAEKKNIYVCMYIPMAVQVASVSQKTWNKNVGKSEAKHPIERHFSQHLPSCPKLSSPSVRQVHLQCKKQISGIESYISLTRKKFHRHGPSDPHAYSTRAKYHAIVLSNSCLVEAPQCDE